MKQNSISIKYQAKTIQKVMILPHLLIGEFSWGRPVCDVTEVT